MHILFTKEEIDKSTIINLSKKYKITHCPILISKKKNYSNIEFDKFEYLILTSSNSLKFLDFSKPLKKFMINKIITAKEITMLLRRRSNRQNRTKYWF